MKIVKANPGDNRAIYFTYVSLHTIYSLRNTAVALLSVEPTFHKITAYIVYAGKYVNHIYQQCSSRNVDSWTYVGR